MLADASGAGERRLTEPLCYDPVFSPNGSLLAFDTTEPWVVTVVDASSGSVVAKTPDGRFPAAWSPDSRRIAYISFGTYDSESGRYTGPTGLFVMNADGTHERRVASKPGDQSRPAWSSRGTIAFLSGGEIWTVEASGRGLRRLGHAADRGLAWSPDGAKLAFVRGDGDFEVFVMNADGSGVKNLTDNQKIQDDRPSWSPDGDSIAFVSEGDDLGQIFAMRVDGSGKRQITTRPGSRAEFPAWSPRT
jgi:Tol biopolymer transport system component